MPRAVSRSAQTGSPDEPDTLDEPDKVDEPDRLDESDKLDELVVP